MKRKSDWNGWNEGGDLFGSDTDSLKSRTENKVKNISAQWGGKESKHYENGKVACVRGITNEMENRDVFRFCSSCANLFIIIGRIQK